ncbi:hypothetical protein BGX34_001631 [Mortierella sp. NVP85]|nr:hypothetical protein BGX34_001631 [Mortierella sp. NVP85]
MDSDWCLFCEKHVLDLGAVYCSKECARMDKLMSVSNKPAAASTSASSLTTAPSSTFKRFAHPSTTPAYPSMYRSSTLVPTSLSSRGGISKSAFTPIPAAATNIRYPSVGRSATRRQPLVLYD